MIKLLKESLKYSKFENAIEIIRIYLGIALFFKGVHFILQPEDLVYWLHQGQLNVIEALVSHYVISAHLVGGLLLTVGLLTRVATAIQIPVLFGALGLVHSSEQLFSISQNIELTSLVLFLLFVFSIIGAGNLSLDYHILEDKNNNNGAFIKRIISRICVNKNPYLVTSNSRKPSSRSTKKSTSVKKSTASKSKKATTKKVTVSKTKKTAPAKKATASKVKKTTTKKATVSKTKKTAPAKKAAVSKAKKPTTKNATISKTKKIAPAKKVIVSKAKKVTTKKATISKIKKTAPAKKTTASKAKKVTTKKATVSKTKKTAPAKKRSR